jgi:glycosyltransferase involved in cell wall biosynthesis
MSNMTVVICNYNYGEYLRGAIDSALKQTAGATQVLVIDDGSTDDSRDIIHSYGERITAIFQENGGQVAAYNRALEHIDSTYVIFLDADDLLYADAVSRVIAAFSSGDYVKVQFTLDVVTHEGAKTGVTVPQSMALSVATWFRQRLPGCGAEADIPHSRHNRQSLWRRFLCDLRYCTVGRRIHARSTARRISGSPVCSKRRERGQRFCGGARICQFGRSAGFSKKG